MRHKLARFLTFLAGILGGVLLIVLARAKLAEPSPPPPPASILVEENVIYLKVSDQSLALDVARPRVGNGPFPAILCIHGGGWQAGNRGEFTTAIHSLAQQGYVAVTIDYRHAPEFRSPAQIEDVKAAVRFIRSKAKEWHVDPDRIGVMGGSAGGHLALMLGTTTDEDHLDNPVENRDFSSAVQAVVSIAGPTDLTRPFPDAVMKMLDDLFGKSQSEAPEAYRRASPIHYLSANDPPVLAIHGTKDELVPYEQATAFVEAAKKLGVQAELFTIADGGHGSGGKKEDWAAAIVKMVEFFNAHLKPTPPVQAARAS